jgi:hypothetical protein
MRAGESEQPHRAVADSVPAGKAAASVAVAAGADVMPALVECASDARETAMVYGEGSRFPRWLMAVWLVAMMSLVAYMVIYALPDLRLWGRP